MGSRPQKNIYIILVNNLVLFLGIVLLFVGLSFTILVLLVLLSRSLGFLRWGCCVLFLLLLQLFLLILAQLRGFCCGFFDFFCFVSSIHFGLLLRSIGFSVHRHWPFVAFLGHVNNFLFLHLLPPPCHPLLPPPSFHPKSYHLHHHLHQEGILCSSTQIKSGFGDVERVLNSLRVLLARLND